jgi:bacterioferritin
MRTRLKIKKQQDKEEATAIYTKLAQYVVQKLALKCGSPMIQTILPDIKTDASWPAKHEKTIGVRVRAAIKEFYAHVMNRPIDEPVVNELWPQILVKACGIVCGQPVNDMHTVLAQCVVPLPKHATLAGDEALRILVGGQAAAQPIIERLTRSFADEWLAYYQYWVGAQVVRGIQRPVLAAELLVHAGEELGHAQQLSDRIIQLGGQPVVDFGQLQAAANCKFMPPVPNDVLSVVSQNLQGEQDAIKTYRELALFLKPQDETSYLLIMSILEKEQEHEEDLSQYIEDISIRTT